MKEQTLFVAQRISAAVLAPLALAHLALILFAVQGGLTAEEILSRTRGNIPWALYYLLFVCAAAVHAPLGARNILREWTGLNWTAIDGLAVLLFALIMMFGIAAVLAVFS